MFRDFTTDLENKLVSALPINAGVRTLSYDLLNRLDTYNPGAAKRFIYDGAEVVAELDASGSILGRYVRGDAPDEIITGYTSSNPTARGWYHLDNRNSVIAVTDPNGTVTVVNRYDEYGQPQGGNYGAFQYTGQMWLGEIGVYNYKNRMYWPNERPGGRFLQTDAAGYADGSNWYAYVHNDPVNGVDPLGLCDSTNATGTTADDCEIVVIAKKLNKPDPSGGGAGIPGVVQPGQPSRPSGPGGGRAAPSPPPKKPTKTQCIQEAAAKNWFGLALDTGAWIATGLFPQGSAAASIAGATIGTAGIGGAVADRDVPAGAVAYLGKQAAVAEGLFRGPSAQLAHRIGIRALTASTLYDLGKLAKDFSNCMRGQ
jgi:RHS repeat-associated protein